MGLQVNKATNYGINITHVHIGPINVDFHAKTSSITWNGYLDRLACEDRKSPLEVNALAFDDSDFFLTDNGDADDIRKQSYAKIKTLPDFLGAVDD